jgi:hypothetical protein
MLPGISAHPLAICPDRFPGLQLLAPVKPPSSLEFGQRDPAFASLALNEGFGRFALRIERVEFLLEAFFGRFSRVDGVSGDAARPDNIIYDIAPNPGGGTGNSAGGFGHPKCLNTADPSTLPAVQ